MANISKPKHFAKQKTQAPPADTLQAALVLQRGGFHTHSTQIEYARLPLLRIPLHIYAGVREYVFYSDCDLRFMQNVRS